MRGRHFSILRVGMVFLLLYFMGLHVDAVNVPKYSLNRLVSESAVIMMGTVTGIHYETEKNDEVFTRIRFQKVKPIKGEQHIKKYLREGITLSFSGGLAQDGLMNVVSGVPRLQLAETYMLFLRGGKWTINPVTGWFQGAFRVVSMGAPEKYLLMNMDGHVLMSVKDGNLQYSDISRDPCEPLQEIKMEGTMKPDTKLKEPPKLKKGEVSLYREDNVEEIEKSDRERVKALEKEPGRAKLPYVQEFIKKTLGGEPLLLDKFVVLIQDADKRTSAQTDKAFREFFLRPELLPKELESFPPPVKK